MSTLPTGTPAFRRLIWPDGRLNYYPDPQVALAVTSGLPRRMGRGFRSAGDLTPVSPWDCVPGY